jgi:uncharacterized protein YdiU (UPF0061 family)
MAPRSKTDAPEGWRFDNSYARLPDAFFTRVHPVPVSGPPKLVVFNGALAAELGLDPDLLGERGADLFAGNRIPRGADPIAQAYAGHQFGHFTNLGDGRAVLLGEQITPGGLRRDIQLKGSGPTPYSRRGDGRAALGPMLREHIIGEAMHALGIPTTRSLAVVSTGDSVERGEMLSGGVLTRVAASHIRTGTFEYARALGDLSLLESLTRHTLKRHYPESVESGNDALALLDGVLERQAALVARWMCVGFVHGVMNTDNMALSGETIDYGPCAFLDTYDPATVFSSIDREGRYAYGKQPDITNWNLARLAETLLPLIHDDQEQAVAAANDAIGRFPSRFQAHHISGFRAKLGLISAEEGDEALIDALLEAMRSDRADFTLSFSALTRAARDASVDARSSFFGPAMGRWFPAWRARLDRQQAGRDEVVSVMCRANPMVIPRNHRVEEALAAAVAGDEAVMHRFLGSLANPFVDNQANGPYREAPLPGGPPYRTFCGT